MRNALTPSSWPVLKSLRLSLPVVVLLLALAALAAYFFLDEKVLALIADGPLVSGSTAVRCVKLLAKAWLLVWLLLVWFLSGRQNRPAVLAGLTALMLTIPLVHPLKVAVGRPRPYALIRSRANPDHESAFHERLSFPSADAAAVCAVAAAILPALGWPLRIGMVPLAATAATLRVAQRAHYPSDALVGAALGVLAAWLAWRLMAHPFVRRHPRFRHERTVAGLGVIGIPLCIGLFEGWSDLLFLLGTYGLAVVLMLVTARLVRMTGPSDSHGGVQKPAPSEHRYGWFVGS